MASIRNGKTLRLALGTMLGVCALSLAGCGSSDRESEEALAASKAQATNQKLAANGPRDVPSPAAAPSPDTQADSGDDSANDASDSGSAYGDMTDPDSGSDKFDNDLSAGMEAPNDFPAPADPPLAGDISPNDMPPPPGPTGQ
ncbi:MAG: hypothetical protein KGL48_05475 [Sphingomonadales bacterium]|nr:hypothetical protein [Sphingomonadales bacterium]MDE2570655.1 hypothetical protein [Sphingomonadales bacterium]